MELIEICKKLYANDEISFKVDWFLYKNGTVNVFYKSDYTKQELMDFSNNIISEYDVPSNQYEITPINFSFSDRSYYHILYHYPGSMASIVILKEKMTDNDKIYLIGQTNYHLDKKSKELIATSFDF